MVVDTSAVIAILAAEHDAPALAAAIEAAPDPLISAASVVEAGIVLIRRHGPDAIDDLWQFPDAAGLEIERLTAKQVQHALEAYARYGRGRHPAALNYSDCMSYALARALERPLLYKGSDFGRTDIAEAC